MTDSKSVVRYGEFFQLLFRYVVFFWKAFTDLTYRENNTANTPEMLCSAEISYHA
jgi:hypothetical protein